MRFSILCFLIILVSCTYNEEFIVYGCSDPSALNYDTLATNNDGSCNYLCDPDIQDFLDLVKPIIDAHCVACHSQSSGRLAILTDYDGVLDAVRSHHLQDEIISGSMPPYGTTSLTTSEIDVISKWINCE